MRRPIFRRIKKSLQYEKTTLVGIIIYVNETDNWCNVELPNGTVLYRIPFRASNYRLRRVQQPVVLTQTVGSRYKYVITGAAERYISSSEFASKGTFKWDDGTKWNDRHVWA